MKGLCLAHSHTPHDRSHLHAPALLHIMQNPFKEVKQLHSVVLFDAMDFDAMEMELV